ncbi:MAG: OB-fold nucleic acid binding domain-containing protein [Candidatus Korarchaeota archaeon]
MSSNAEEKTSEVSPAAVKRCPSCGRLIGDVTECPYCHARVYKRISLKALFILVALVLAGSGLSLYLVPYGQPNKYKISELTELNNYWHVAIEGTVIGRPYYSASQISFDVSDGTGTIRVVLEPPGMDEWTKNPSNVPAIGDHVFVEGDAYVRGDSKKIYVTNAEWIRVSRSLPVAHLRVNDLVSPYHNFSYVNKKAYVTGVVVNLKKYAGGGINAIIIDPDFIVGLNSSPVPIWNESKQLPHYGLTVYIGGDHAALCKAQEIVGNIRPLQKITMLASITEYNGYLELIPADFSTITTEELWPYAVPIATILGNFAEYSGKLVLVRGRINTAADGITKIGTSSVGYYITDDGTNKLEVFGPGMLDDLLYRDGYPAMYEEILTLGAITEYSGIYETVLASYSCVLRNKTTTYISSLSTAYHMTRVTVKITTTGSWTSTTYFCEMSGTVNGTAVTIRIFNVLNSTVYNYTGVLLPPAGTYYVTGIYYTSGGNNYLYVTSCSNGYEMGPA